MCEHPVWFVHCPDDKTTATFNDRTMAHASTNNVCVHDPAYLGQSASLLDMDDSTPQLDALLGMCSWMSSLHMALKNVNIICTYIRTNTHLFYIKRGLRYITNVVDKFHVVTAY